jgi:RNA polymerase sigma factor (sigma-70 family)
MRATLDPSELDAARSGDRRALEKVLGQSRQDLRRYAEYHCEVNDIEDAVQESLITASRKLMDLRQIEAFASWLFRIVKRECNRLKRLTRRSWGEPLGEDIAGPHYPEKAALARDLGQVLRTIPAHYRQVLLMRDLEGLSIEEICERTRLSKEAAKARLHRARALCRSLLMDPDPLPA